MALLCLAIAVMTTLFAGTVAVVLRNRRASAARMADALAVARAQTEVKAREAERAFAARREARGVTNPDGTVMVGMKDVEHGETWRDDGGGDGDAMVVVNIAGEAYSVVTARAPSAV